MKNKNIVAALAAFAIAAGGYGIYQFGRHQGMRSTPEHDDAAPAAGASGKKPLYWHDPMVPGQKFDKPGKSPFMDMQLVPVYADADADNGAVSISPRIEQNLGIRTAIVTAGKLSSGVAAVGSVAYNERDVALVQARSNGFIERLYVRAALDPVKQGQPLAELYVPDWIAAQEEFLAARRMQGGDTASLVDGARQRMRLAGMTEGQIRLVESSGTVHPRITLSAPVSGVVSELGAREGMTVALGAQLFRINGLSTIWVNADLPENAAAKVRPGDAVEARSPALPGSVFKGKVGAVLAEVDSATRTLKARIELANPGGQLVPGMFATVTFASNRAADVLLVPSEAVIQTGTRSVVILAQDGGKFQPVDVELGGEGNGQTEILKGLRAGQKIVLSGQFLLDSEASLKGTTSRMGDTQPAGATSASIHHGQGKVERIGTDEVTISHGPISSLQWGEMTMGFKTPPSGLPRSVAVGDQVAFDFKPSQGGGFEIVAISPVADKSMSGMKMPAAPTGAKK